MNTLGLANKVKLNLTHSIHWSNITTLSVKSVSKRESDTRRKLLSPDDQTFILLGTNCKTGETEYVLALSKRTQVTLENMDNVFKQLSTTNGFQPVDKILLAIVDTDGSIMYNYISRGVKSVQNGI